MQTHVQKWGNSLSVRIPSTFSRQLRINAGSLVEMKIDGDCIIIRAPHYKLEELLSQINESNIHSQLLDDSQKGNEEW